jgi:hypothetical protein
MLSEKSLLRGELKNAMARSFKVFRHSKQSLGAKRSGIYALGRFEGLREALRLLDHRRLGVPKPEIFGPPAPVKPSRAAFLPFALLF